MHEQRIASSTDKRADRRPTPDLRPAGGESEESGEGNTSQLMRPRKRCLLRPALVLAHAGALGGHGGEGMHEAPDGGAAHVERERAKDERGDDARALEVRARDKLAFLIDRSVTGLGSDAAAATVEI
ncbi:hypothetical protein DFH09DRAFT_1348350 [Mycena vulgaris]|nr:hypothetical protein DFH09DRAFT_1348350 [Mycena vulgaris]